MRTSLRSYRPAVWMRYAAASSMISFSSFLKSAACRANFPSTRSLSERRPKSARYVLWPTLGSDSSPTTSSKTDRRISQRMFRTSRSAVMGQRIGRRTRWESSHRRRRIAASKRRSTVATWPRVRTPLGRAPCEGVMSGCPQQRRPPRGRPPGLCHQHTVQRPRLERGEVEPGGDESRCATYYSPCQPPPFVRAYSGARIVRQHAAVELTRGERDRQEVEEESGCSDRCRSMRAVDTGFGGRRTDK